MRGGLQLVAVGLVLGLACATGAARLIQTLLFDVQPMEPLVYAAVALLFTCVGVPEYQSRAGGGPGTPVEIKGVQPRLAS